jgi:transposase
MSGKPGAVSFTSVCVSPLSAPARKIGSHTCVDRSRNVGAYLGLTTRRYASGEIDWTGRISMGGLG